MPSYEVEEILLPDFSTAPNLPHDLNAPFVVYNLRFNGSAYPEYPGHYVCRNEFIEFFKFKLLIYLNFTKTSRLIIE